MTSTTAPDRATVDRASHVFNSNTKLDWDQALDEARSQLAAEAAEAAEGQRKAAESAEGFRRLMTCAVPGCQGGRRPDNGMCDPHTKVLNSIEAEEAGAQLTPDGQTVRAWLAGYRALHKAS